MERPSDRKTRRGAEGAGARRMRGEGETNREMGRRVGGSSCLRCRAKVSLAPQLERSCGAVAQVGGLSGVQSDGLGGEVEAQLPLLLLEGLHRLIVVLLRNLKKQHIPPCAARERGQAC